MILSELLGCRVLLEDRVVGHVIDLRLIPDRQDTDEAMPDQPMPRLRIYGLVVSPHAKSSTLGYERNAVRAPRSIAAFQRWRHRGSFLVRWSDIESVRPERIALRAEHRRYSARLIRSAAKGPDFDDREN